MSLDSEIEELRERLTQWAAEADVGLTRRYALRPIPTGASAYRKLRLTAGRLLRRWGLRRARPPEPWLPGLKHVEHDDGAMPLVIWALGVDRDTLRAACRGFEARRTHGRGFVPVLVTDVADFAFFSRLGWLVEYVPKLSGPGSRFAERKQRYLAWLYRDAEAVPVSAGLTADDPPERLFVPSQAMGEGN